MSGYSNYLGSKKCCTNNLAKTVTGPQGAKGAQGAIGPYGQQGSTGAIGLRGATGPCCRGPPGFTGAQGSTGPPGAFGGPKGDTGTQGATGLQGATGSQGATGASQWTNMNGVGIIGTGYTGIGVTGQDVLIYGNLLVTGTIDPTSIILSNTTNSNTINLDSITNNLITNSTFGINSADNITITADNIDLSSAGRLILPSLASTNYFDYNTGTLTLKTDNVGYTTNKLMLLENKNATAGNTNGVPSLEFYKSGRNGATNDVIMSQQFNALDYTGTNRTFGKIECSVTNSSVGFGNDGALDFYSCVNNVNNIVFRMNGANNENNCFRPLDMVGNDIKTTTGDMLITSTASTGTGNITLNSKGSIGLTSVANDIDLNSNTTIAAQKSLSLSKSAAIVSTQVLNGESIINSDLTNSITATFNTSKLEILDTPNNQYSLLNKQKLELNDTTNNKSINIDNDPISTQNRIDFYKNAGAGIYAQSGLVNDTTNQTLSLLYQDNALGRSLSVDNNSANGGVIQYADQLGGQPFTIESTTGETIVKAPNTFALTLDSDILNLKNTNTTTTSSNHNADIRVTSTGLETTTFLKLKLGGVDIWIPYFTTDPSL